MRVAFLVQDLQLSGGVGVVVEHASQLNRHHGFDCRLVLTREPDREPWSYRGLADVPVLALAEAEQKTFDVVVATWWETCFSLFRLEAQRYAYFLQLLEDSTYSLGPPGQMRLPAPERMSAAMTTALPVRFITEAKWIAEAVEALQPGNRALYVRNGIAKDVFASPDNVAPRAPGEPLRVVIEGSRAVVHKGVDDALTAVRLMSEPHHLTFVSPDSSGADLEDVDEVVSKLSHAEMAQLLARSHVTVKLSRAEGMYGPPLEAFHMGATVVTTPVTGFDEYVRHAFNGMVVGWDDPHGTARVLDLLARDEARLHFLRSNALVTARAWPSWEQSSAFMALALAAVLREPPPDPSWAGRRLVSDMASQLAESQRQALAFQIRGALLEELWRQKAWRYSIKVRRQWHRLIRPLRWLASRLRRSD